MKLPKSLSDVVNQGQTMHLPKERETTLSTDCCFSHRLLLKSSAARSVWRYHRGNQNPQIEGQTTNTMAKWKKWQNDKQRPTQHYTEN